MMMTLVMFVTMVGAATPVAQAPAPAPVQVAMPLDTCVRACLACDKTGNPVSCAVCALCSEPAVSAPSDQPAAGVTRIASIR